MFALSTELERPINNQGFEDDQDYKNLILQSITSICLKMSAEEVKEGSVESITAAKLLEDLKRENERILEEHKREIEAKYESQMQDFLRRLAPPPRRRWRWRA